MIPYDETQPLISIHIPKAGGTTFRKILREWFSQQVRFHYFDEENGEMPKKHPLAPGMCVHGHFNMKRQFGVRDYYPEARQFIMFLRDPFEIVVSRFFFVKRKEKEGTSFRDGEVLALNDDADEYIKCEINRPDYHPNILDYMPSEFTIDNYKQIIDRNFIYIGIMEDFSSSIAKMAAALNRPVPQTLIQHNSSPRYQEIKKEYRRIFMDNHPLEYMVYNYALQKHKDF